MSHINATLTFELLLLLILKLWSGEEDREARGSSGEGVILLGGLLLSPPLR